MLKPSQSASGFLAAQIASAVAIVVGCVVLLGWYFDIEVIKSGFITSKITMKVNEALCFLFGGASLWLFLKGHYSGIGYHIGMLCARFLIVLGGLTFGEYILGWDLGIDQLLFVDTGSQICECPGRMGLNAALNFMLLGRALELL